MKKFLIFISILSIGIFAFSQVPKSEPEMPADIRCYVDDKPMTVLQLSTFKEIFKLLPIEVQQECVASFNDITISPKAKITYGGINVYHPSPNNWVFKSGKYRIEVRASMEELQDIFTLGII